MEKVHKNGVITAGITLRKMSILHSCRGLFSPAGKGLYPCVLQYGMLQSELPGEPVTPFYIAAKKRSREPGFMTGHKTKLRRATIDIGFIGKEPGKPGVCLL